ncbi:MAG: PqqD family protein [Wenzhouxiangella sp.]
MQSDVTDLNSMFKRTPSGIGADVNESMIVLDGSKGEYYSLNSVGRHIWLQLEEERSVEELVESVCAEYEVEPAACFDAVAAFLGDMVKLGLVGKQ